jgi:hypothetical protein
VWAYEIVRGDWSPDGCASDLITNTVVAELYGVGRHYKHCDS